AHSSQPKGKESERKLAAFLANLACSRDDESPLYVARGLLRQFEHMFRDQPSTRQFFTDQLRQGKSDRAACPGVDGFTEDDWALLDRLVAAAQEPPPDAETK